MSMVDTTQEERAIAERINPTTMATVKLSQQGGGLGFSNMAEAMQFAKIMAISGYAVPKHLRGQIGACMAITIQAIEWRMSPYAVANKSYLVNERMAYESQLVQAVILQRAPVTAPFNAAFSGDGERRQCTVTATLEGGGERIYTSPEIGKIPVKNSPLWKNDPDQQLYYYAARSLCRRFFPDVLLGIYTPDEFYEETTRRGPEHARDVTPTQSAVGNRQHLVDGEPAYNPPKNPNTDEVDDLVSDGLTPHDHDTGEVLSDEMAERARETTEALNDPSGDKAGELLAQQLAERGGKRIMGLT